MDRSVGVVLMVFVIGCGGGPGPADGSVCSREGSCEAVGSRCDGDDMVVCGMGADGCLAEVRTRCEGCVVQDGMPRCGNVCEGVPEGDRCATEGRTCADTDTLEVCAPNASGCLVRARTSCESGCTSAGGTATCAGEMCEDECAAERRACVDDVLEVCERGASGCLRRADVDCAARSEICGERGGVASCGTLCSFRPACAPRCVDGMATTCVPDEDGCMVEGPTMDCGEQTCVEGVGCVGACPSARPEALACNTTVTGNNAGGGNVFDSFACVTPTYGGPEVVHVVSVPEDQWIELAVSWAAGASEDYDLVVLDGGEGTEPCGPALPCVEASIGRTSSEWVGFHARAGRLYYVVLTRVAGTGEITPTDYSIEVGCRPVPSDCTYMGFRPETQSTNAADGWFFYEAFQMRGGALHEFGFHLDRSRASEGTHDFTFTGENYSECHTCAVGGRDCLAGECTWYLATEGTVHFDELTFSTRVARGRVDDLRMIEVRLAGPPTYESTPVASGRTWCVPSMRFSAP